MVRTRRHGPSHHHRRKLPGDRRCLCLRQLLGQDPGKRVVIERPCRRRRRSGRVTTSTCGNASHNPADQRSTRRGRKPARPLAWGLRDRRRARAYLPNSRRRAALLGTSIGWSPGKVPPKTIRRLQALHGSGNRGWVPPLTGGRLTVRPDQSCPRRRGITRTAQTEPRSRVDDRAVGEPPLLCGAAVTSPNFDPGVCVGRLVHDAQAAVHHLQGSPG